MNVFRSFFPLARLKQMVLCLGLMCAAALTAHAQQKEDPLKVQRAGNLPGQPNQNPGNQNQGNQNQSQGGGVIQQATRPMYLQGAVTVLLMGGAVWTVCRNSRRM